MLEGIEAAKRVGLTPIKINTVALGGFNDDEFGDFIELTRDHDISVRFIELMPIGHADVGEGYGFISNQELIDRFPSSSLSQRKNFQWPQSTDFLARSAQ